VHSSTWQTHGARDFVDRQGFLLEYAARYTKNPNSSLSLLILVLVHMKPQRKAHDTHQARYTTSRVPTLRSKLNLVPYEDLLGLVRALASMLDADVKGGGKERSAHTQCLHTEVRRECKGRRELALAGGAIGLRCNLTHLSDLRTVWGWKAATMTCAAMVRTGLPNSNSAESLK
jgi:hypothetical protein